MKRFTTLVAAILFVCATFTVAASAKVKSRVITIGQDFTVAGTTVKAGTYRFSFDDQKNELTVSDRKTKEVLARAEARTEDFKDNASLASGVQLVGNTAPLAIAGVSFGGKQIVRVAGAAAQGR